MKTIKTYNSQIEAFGDMAILEDEGIEAFIKDTEKAIELQVNESETEQARSVLENED